ncbi:hypothetical protein [uncultured Mediterranean phage]|nr:hypothetical protein [uncultured Mediterranean phage]
MHTKLGFIGAGKQAREHAQAAVAQGAEIAHIANSDGKLNENIDKLTRLSQTPGLVTKVSIAADLLKDDELDAIIVSLPWDVTCHMMEALMASPLPMLIEKPIILDHQFFTSREGQENKWAGFNRRFYDTVELLKSHVKTKGMKSAEVTISEHIQAIVKRHSQKIVPHLWETHCAHLLDLMTYVFGRLSLKSVYRHTDEEFTSVTALFERNGTPVTLHVNNNDPSPVGIRARFPSGETWVLSPIEQLTIFKGVEVIPADKDNPIRKYVGRIASSFWEKGQYKPGIYEQMDAFLQGRMDNAATVADAVQLHSDIKALRGG